jgi:hypothetical protein
LDNRDYPSAQKFYEDFKPMIRKCFFSIPPARLLIRLASSYSVCSTTNGEVCHRFAMSATTTTTILTKIVLDLDPT